MTTTRHGRHLVDQRVYRRLFIAAYGEFPHPCAFCGKPIEMASGRSGQSAVIHHIDEDRSNNAPENLTSMHRGCHNKHHRSWELAHTPEARAKRSATAMGAGNHFYGKTHTPEARAKISAKSRAYWTPERRAALSGEGHPNYGKTWPAEVRARMSAAQRALGRKHTPEAIEKMRATKIGALNPNYGGKAMTVEARAKLSAANLGRKHTPGAIEKMRQAAIEREARKRRERERTET
jgi:hypothetical protein